MVDWIEPKTLLSPDNKQRALVDYIVKNDLLYLKTNIAIEAAVELTIANGAVTKTYSHHTIDTEADEPTDDLETVNGGAEGEVILIRPADGARTIVVKHDVGNIWLPGGADISLDNADAYLMLVYSSSKWVAIAGSGADPAHRVRVANSAPALPCEGDIYIDSVENALYIATD